MERTASETHRIAVFSSGLGRGSNLAAIHRYLSATNQPVQIALAVFTRAASPAYALAKDLGISSCVVPAKEMPAFERQVLSLITDYRIELIALAGFMKQLSENFLSLVHIPVLNIHPALLPKYGGKGMYGMAVHEAVFAAGEELSGASIHRVDPLYDHGEILAQKTVDIRDCKSASEVAKAVLKAEHELYGPTICKVLLRL